MRCQLSNALVCMAGAVCDGLDMKPDALKALGVGSQNYLREKHLVACDISWCAIINIENAMCMDIELIRSPYLIISDDESKSGNDRYSGLDVDVLKVFMHLHAWSIHHCIDI